MGALWIMIVKVKIKNELYVYMNGSLLYKRWLNQDYGKVFNCQVYKQPFSAKEVESFKK